MKFKFHEANEFRRAFWNFRLKQKLAVRVDDETRLVYVYHGHSRGEHFLDGTTPFRSLESLRSYLSRFGLSAASLDAIIEDVVRLQHRVEESEAKLVRPLEITFPAVGCKHVR